MDGGTSRSPLLVRVSKGNYGTRGSRRSLDYSESEESIDLEELRRQKPESYDSYYEQQHIGQFSDTKLRQLRNTDFSLLPKGDAALEYEERQKEYQDALAEFDEGNFSGEDGEAETRLAKFAIWGSFAINVGLTVAKLIILLSSGSVSVLASFLDSVLDLLSGSVIFLTSFMKTVPQGKSLKWPVGRKRLDALAVLIFAATMFTATGQILVESIRNLLQQENIQLNVDGVTIGVLAGTIGIKLVLWFICSRVNDIAVEALAEDHRNDVFSNGIAICTVVGGFYWRPWLDPIGGILISLYIMNGWLETGMEYLRMMMGKSASPELLSKLTYIAYRHDNRIRQVDTVRAYSVSENYFVEVDIVLAPKMTLREAHDVGEGLQIKLEKLPEVDRAFVHLDYEWTHRPTDEHKDYHT